MLIALLFSLLTLFVPLHAEVFKLPPTEVRGKAQKVQYDTTTTLEMEKKIGFGWVENPTTVLDEMPSIFVVGSPKGKRLFLRGLTERDMKILINGVPIGQKGIYYTRGFEWDIIPFEFIERIEVTRGLPSSEFGDSISGVINIITKKGTKKAKTILKGSYGRFDDWKFSFIQSGKRKRLDWVLGGYYRDSGDYLENNVMQNFDVFGTLGLEADLGKFRLNGFLSHRKEGYTLDTRVLAHSQSSSSIYKYVHGSYYNLDKQFIQLLYEKHPFNVILSYSRELRNDNPKKYSWKPRDVSDYKHDYRTYVARIKAEKKISKHFLKTGVEIVRETWDDRWERGLRSLRRDNFEKNYRSFFIEDGWSLSKAISLNFGIRYEWVKNRIKGTWGRADHNLSPRISLNFTPRSDLTFYAFASRVFKSPTLADLSRWYGNYMLYSPSGRALLRTIYNINQPPYAPASIIPSQYVSAWRNLLGKIGPSRGWDYEAGVKWEKENLALGVNLFFEDIDDYVIIYPSYYPATYNVKNLKLWGLELETRWTPIENLELSLAYTFEENDLDGDFIKDFMFNKDVVLDVPKHTLTFLVRAEPMENLKIEWKTKVVSRRFAGSGSPTVPLKGLEELPGYGLSSLRSSYTKVIKGIPVTFSLAAENIFSKRTWQRSDYYTPPISLYGGIKLEF